MYESVRACVFWGRTSGVDKVAYLGRKKNGGRLPQGGGQLPMRRAYDSPIIGSITVFGRNELRFLICSVAMNLVKFCYGFELNFEGWEFAVQYFESKFE